MELKFLTWLVFFSFLIGCSADVNDIQSIDIEAYRDNDKNVKLAEDLVYYDPRYIAHKVRSFDEDTARGIKLDYFLSSSNGKPSYRITYNLKVSAVASNLETLKSDFENYIPKLAAIHASKEQLFQKLAPVGEKWANSIFEHSAASLLAESSDLLKKSITEKQLSDVIEMLIADFGGRISTTFIRAQYYEEFSGMPESVSLYYSQSFSSQKKVLVRVSMLKENDQWLVMGFNVKPQT